MTKEANVMRVQREVRFRTYHTCANVPFTVRYTIMLMLRLRISAVFIWSACCCTHCLVQGMIWERTGMRGVKMVVDVGRQRIAAALGLVKQTILDCFGNCMYPG